MPVQWRSEMPSAAATLSNRTAAATQTTPGFLLGFLPPLDEWVVEVVDNRWCASPSFSPVFRLIFRFGFLPSLYDWVVEFKGLGVEFADNRCTSPSSVVGAEKQHDGYGRGRRDDSASRIHRARHRYGFPLLSFSFLSLLLLFLLFLQPLVKHRRGRRRFGRGGSHRVGRASAWPRLLFAH